MRTAIKSSTMGPFKEEAFFFCHTDAQPLTETEVPAHAALHHIIECDEPDPNPTFRTQEEYIWLH